MNGVPSIIVCARSENWCGAIKRQFQPHPLAWCLGTDGLVAEAATECASVAIVEIPIQNPESACLEVANLRNNPFNLEMFAIGNGPLNDLAPLLQASGFCAWYDSLLQIPDLARAVVRYQSFVPPTRQPLEQVIWRNLPWRAHHRTLPTDS